MSLDHPFEAGKHSHQLALDVLSARQLVRLEPERAVRDFIDQLRGGPRSEFKDIATMAFGTKRYDRWDRQRYDVRFGYAPRHGTINMDVYLRAEWRAVVGKHLDRLPVDLVEAAVRVLEAMLEGRLPSDTLAGEAP
jgi:hypothetical protein